MNAQNQIAAKPLNNLLLISGILILVYVLAFIVPSGEYQRRQEDGITVVVPGSYSQIQKIRPTVMELLSAPARGFSASADVIAFVLLIGGAFGVIGRTGALEAGLKSMVHVTSRHKRLKKLFPALLLMVFSLAGNTFGMSEEVLLFVMITVPMAHQMGYDTLTGLAIPFVGAAVGFAGAAFNPFTVGVAQGIAQLPPFSGFEYRMGVWMVFTLAAIAYVYGHIRKVAKNPSAGFFSDIRGFETGSDPTHSRNVTTLLIIFGMGLVLMMVGVKLWEWYIAELAGMFIGMAVVVAVIGRLQPQEATDAFLNGCRDMVPVVVVIGLSRSILVLAEDAGIIDTLLYGIVQVTEGLPGEIAVQMMFLTQGLINFFIPSGSGQAALTMPLMTPLVDLMQINRQTAVLAFQFGDGIFNMIIPTSGVTVGVLSLTGIPFNVWVRWCMKLVLWLVILAGIALAIGVFFPNVWQ